jgi:hypothetical protein
MTPLTTIPAGDLAEHPLLSHIPVWSRNQAEFIALTESIRERGLDYPVLIDAEHRIIDGRNRRNACAVLKRPVECRQIAAGDAASVIVASLVNRRHLTKGALAYLSAPLFETVLDESNARRLANLKQGRPETALSAVSVKTADDVAAQLGISLRLFEQALKLRRMFEEAAPEVRQTYEPRILGEWQDEAGEWQDPVGLGYMINGLTSLLTEAAGRKKQLGKRAQHDRLFVGYLPKLKEHWKKANASQRAEITQQLKAEVTKWPGELRDEIAAALRSAARADRE